MAKKNFLDSIHVPAPCAKNWDEMTGGEEKRFCSGCEKNVYNISAMPRAEARRLVAKNAGKICIRYTRLPNGKVLTAENELHQISRRTSAIAAGVIAATLTLSALNYAQGEVKIQTEKPHSIIITQIAKKSGSPSKISVTISDQNGAIIHNAKIILIGKNESVAAEGVSNDEGKYEFKNILPSDYKLQIERDGFEPVIKTDLQLTKDKNLEIRVTLEGILITEVGLVSQPNHVESEPPKISEIISARPLESLPPLKNKYFLGLVAGNSKKTSQISFTVYDSSGAVIPEAEVKLTNQQTKAEFNAATNRNGAANFGLIPHGRYELEIDSPGFKSYKQIIQIKEEIEPNVKITLEVGGIGEFIIVKSEIPLFRAITQEDNETVKNLIISGFDVNTKDRDNQTALHVAVEHENIEIVRFLLERGAKVNAKNRAKYTPILMLEDNLSEKNNQNTAQILSLLIAKGADVNVRNEEKETLLMLACQNENLAVVKILLEAKADPNLKDEDGETAFEQTKSAEIKRVLQSYGAR